MALHDFLEFDKQNNILSCKGKWDLEHLPQLIACVNRTNIPAKENIKINGEHIEKLDSAGVWMITRGISSVLHKETDIQLETFSEQQQKLFALVKKNRSHSGKNEKAKSSEQLNWLQKLGKFGLIETREFHEYVSFIGELYYDMFRLIGNFSKWRLNAVISVINRSGAGALGIIALLSFMIGVVIAYQMGNQLQKYGADIFIVDLMGLSVLREFGPLLTAIMVGGRTGSAFTAQLGIMKINQEIDALQTMGNKPTQLLLLPRLIGLFLAVPLLTIWADIFGVLGGMGMAKYLLNISWYDFLLRFQHEVTLKSLSIGLLKAPVFALIIATIGCFEGMKVYGSAESVGLRTTRSVVLSIFYVIIFDAVVSVLLSRYNL